MRVQRQQAWTVGSVGSYTSSRRRLQSWQWKWLRVSHAQIRYWHGGQWGCHSGYFFVSFTALSYSDSDWTTLECCCMIEGCKTTYVLNFKAHHSIMPGNGQKSACPPLHNVSITADWSCCTAVTRQRMTIVHWPVKDKSQMPVRFCSVQCDGDNVHNGAQNGLITWKATHTQHSHLAALC